MFWLVKCLRSLFRLNLYTIRSCCIIFLGRAEVSRSLLSVYSSVLADDDDDDTTKISPEPAMENGVMRTDQEVLDGSVLISG